MGKELFAKGVIEKLRVAIGNDGSAFGTGTANVAMSAVAEAVTEYLKEHVKVYVSYQGLTLSFPPMSDVVASEEFSIEGKCPAPSPSDSFERCVKEI